MRELFWLTASLSLSGAILIVLIWGLTRLLRNRCGQHWRYYVWLVVVARLLIPYAPENSPLDQLGSAVLPIVTGQQAQQEQWGPEESVLEPPAQNGFGPEREASAASFWLGLLRHDLWVVWLLVSLVLLIRKATLYQSFGKYLCAGQAEVSDPELLNLLGDLCIECGISHPPELFCNRLVSSPLLLGIRKPAIVLPQLPANREQLRLVLLHELIHYRRCDLLYKWLLQLTLCLHWFNPLVYLMVREANQACELSCDASVLRLLDGAGRRRYGAMLVDSLSSPGTYREGVAAVTLSENAKLLKERLAAIKTFQVSKKRSAVLAVLLSVCLLIGGFAAGIFTTGLGWYDFSAGPLTGEGLPVMSAKHRVLYEQYLEPVAITGLFSVNFTPEDVSNLLENNGSLMKSVFTAAVPNIFDSDAGAVPAKLVEDTLTAWLPVRQWMIREAFGDIYNETSDTYALYGGLGGGPSTVIVTGSHREGDLLAVQYTWYRWGVDDGAETGRYEPGDSGEVILRLKSDRFMYLSNQVGSGD